MDYHWMGGHDPIRIDSNLAHIDFDDFKNEDLQTAFAYSFEGDSSGTDMSICKSEQLFSSFKELPGEVESIIEDSLTQEDFKYTNQVKPNKNAYTLTYSGLAASVHHETPETGSLPEEGRLTTWSNVQRRQHPLHQRPSLDRGRLQFRDDGEYSGDAVSRMYSKDAGAMEDVRQFLRRGEDRGRERGRDGEEEQNNNAMLEENNKKSKSMPNISKGQPMYMKAAAWGAADPLAAGGEEKFSLEAAATSKEGASNEEAKLINLYMKGRAQRNSWNGEGFYFEKQDPQLQQQQGSLKSPLTGNPGTNLGAKEKDAINEFLRKSRLTSIDENYERSSSSSEDNTVRPVPTPRQRSVTSMSTTPSGGTSLQQSPTPSSFSPLQNQSMQGGASAAGMAALGTLLTSSSHRPFTAPTGARDKRAGSNNFPELDFLENDCALWDTFFLTRRVQRAHSSVLQGGETHPVEEYIKKSSGNNGPQVRDANSLRILLPSSQQHLLKQSPISQVCESLSLLSTSQYTEQKVLQEKKSLPVEVVKVREAWAPSPEYATTYTRESTSASNSNSNLNLLNNNNQTSRSGRSDDRGGQTTPQRGSSAPRRRGGSGEEIGGRGGREEKAMKRRSYHPQDGLSQLLKSPITEKILSSRKITSFPKSGSQGNLCDSDWLDEETADITGLPGPSVSQQPGLPNYDNKSASSRLSRGSEGKSTSAEYPFMNSVSFNNHSSGANFDLTHKRGLFVNLYSAVERILLFHDPSPTYSNRSAVRCVLLHEFCPALHAILEDGLKEEVITSFGRMKTSVWRVIEAVIQGGPAQRATCDLVMLLNTKFSSEEDFKKFSGFVIGLLNMSSLHIWFSKLKWSMDVLLRFYQRNAFICALHKDTKLLFDELMFCLQRLFSVPFHLDMPFNSGILEEIPGEELYKKREHCCNCACSKTSQHSSEATTPGSVTTVSSSRSSRTSRSRIPRPISLPKRLEEKLSVKNSPARSGSAGSTNPITAKSPVKPPPRPKSRVRDTIKLFDAKYNKSPHRGAASMPPIKASAGGERSRAAALRQATSLGGGGNTGARLRARGAVTSPKTGGGEGMAGDGIEKFK